MQLRCSNCQRPFALNRDAIYTALDQVYAENLSHYNAQCPHCRRVNRVSKKQLRRAAPNWSPDMAKESESDAESTEEAGDG